MEDNLGSRTYRRLDVAIYGYEDIEDAQYAVKFWFDEFMEGRSIRPGRPVRSYEYAKPTIVIIDSQHIAVFQMDCRDYFPEEYDEWVRSAEEIFGSETSMTIEVECGGPLEWTRNAPDPRARRR
jgi:hypothetical protein